MSLYESGNSNGSNSLASLFNDGAINENIVSNLTLEDISKLVVKGGWPQSVNKSLEIAIRQNKSYVDLIASEEMETVDGKIRDSHKVLELLKSIARNTSTAASDQTILADVKANNESMHITTLNEYVKTLKELYVIEDLPAWTPKLRSKATIRTKHERHFTDPAISAVLLNASPNDLIYDIETFGLLFESMVIRDLKSILNI